MLFLSNKSLLVTSSYCGKILSFDGDKFIFKNILEIKNVYISMIKIIENSNNLDIISLIKPGRILIWKYIKSINYYKTFQEIKDNNFDYCDLLKLELNNTYIFVSILNKIFFNNEKKQIDGKNTESYFKQKVFNFKQFGIVLSTFENSMIQINKSTLLITAHNMANLSYLLVLFNYNYMEIVSIYETMPIILIYKIKPNYLLINFEKNNKSYLKGIKIVESELIFEKLNTQIDSNINSVILFNKTSIAASMNDGTLIIYNID